MEDVKIKISVLWLFKIVADLVSGILSFVEPGVIDMIRDGELYGEVLGGLTCCLYWRSFC